MENAIETVEFKRGVVGKIFYDEDAESPREWDNLGKMVTWHRNYNLGDEQPKISPFEYRRQMAIDADPSVEDKILKIDGEVFLEEDTAEFLVNELIEKTLNKYYVILPCYLYDHGGITMSTGPFSCPWDSGQVGFIFVSVADVKKEYGWKVLTKARREQIEKYLEGEVETYDQYLTGQVYIYDVEVNGDNVDSCGGFYGIEYCREEMKSAAEYRVEQIEAELAEETIVEVAEEQNAK